MTSRILFVAGLLSISTLAFASKTYEVTLANMSKAGNVQLKAGEYRVKVDNGKAVFTGADGHEYTVDVKTKSASQKFEETRVDANKEGNVDTLKDIQLGGSTTQIEF
ncbi:MAG TPA: hypothetical protein VML19_27295 [Verrucomicrobiae bacterium]|nr:hypothetical protein [Verrucomicrobiae bacterium]